MNRYLFSFSVVCFYFLFYFICLFDDSQADPLFRMGWSLV